MATPEDLRIEYEQVNENFRALADIRFKLVALVPPLGGAAAYILARLTERQADHALVLAISILGFLATLGITFYDQRNSHLYNALGDRAKAIEHALGISDGQFTVRPTRTRRLLFLRVGHDPALALIYAPVLGAWFFPAVVSGRSLLGASVEQARTAGFVAAAVATALFLEEFLRLDGVWRRILSRILKMTRPDMERPVKSARSSNNFESSTEGGRGGYRDG